MAERTHWSGFDRSGMSSDQRDELIARLRSQGWTLKRIAERVGMSTSGVHDALGRVADGRPGRDPRH
jgi:DNA-binding NarL/FixJ family response regulator